MPILNISNETLQAIFKHCVKVESWRQMALKCIIYLQVNGVILRRGQVRLGIGVHIRMPRNYLRNSPNLGRSSSNLLLEPMLGLEDLELFSGEIKKTNSFRLTKIYQDSLAPHSIISRIHYPLTIHMVYYTQS